MSALPDARLGRPSSQAIILLGCGLFPSLFFPVHMLLLGIAVALLFPVRTLALVAQLRAEISRPLALPYWTPILLAGVLSLALSITADLPSSDGLRHLVAYLVDYDWTSHYDNDRYFTTWSWWIGYEVVVGAAHGFLGGNVELAATVVVAATFALILIGFAAFLGQQLPGRIGLQCVILLMLAALAHPRAVGARPDALMLFLIPGALWMPRRAWFAAALLFAPAYWFSPVYGIASLLLPARSRREFVGNLALGATYTGGAVAFWYAYSGGEYFAIRELLGAAIAQQFLMVDELQPIGGVIGAPQVMMAISLALFALYHVFKGFQGSDGPIAEPRVLLVLAVALFFCVPDYARYAHIVSILLVCATTMLLARVPHVSVVPLLAGIGVYTLAMVPFAHPGTLPPELLAERVYAVPDRARVLSPFTSDVYLVTASNPHAVVTPIFDPGMVTPDTQPLVATLTKGSFPDCGDVVGRFDYIAESTVTGSVPDCLSLVRFNGKYRLWRIDSP